VAARDAANRRFGRGSLPRHAKRRHAHSHLWLAGIRAIPATFCKTRLHTLDVFGRLCASLNIANDAAVRWYKRASVRCAALSNISPPVAPPKRHAYQPIYTKLLSPFFAAWTISSLAAHDATGFQNIWARDAAGGFIAERTTVLLNCGLLNMRVIAFAARATHRDA